MMLTLLMILNTSNMRGDVDNDDDDRWVLLLLTMKMMRRRMRGVRYDEDDEDVV